MAVYRNVQVNFWQDDFVLDLTPEERYFYVYLLTCSKTTQCGIFPFPKRLAEMETGYNRETVDKLVQRFVDYGKILYDAETRELFVLNWLRYNPVTNTNVEKSEKVIGETITALCELEEKDSVCEFDLKDALVDLYEELHQDVKEITGIETGYTSLNKMTCGLQEGDFVVLGARPSMGKTAFALNVGLHAAKSGAVVGLFSLEMSSKQLLKRMASCVGEVSGGRLKNPKHRFAIEDWEKVSKAFAEIGELPFEIYDNAGISVQDIWMQTRKLKRKHGDKKVLVIVDYLQLITGDLKHKGNRFQEISEISRKLKVLARELNVCVVALSQLSRSVEARQDKRPLLSDLRETGQIEQDADVIMLMYREDYYDKETVQKEMTEIHVAKHRNGPVGSFKLRFMKEFGRFVEVG